MAEYHLTNKALEDLNGIWDYTFDNWTEDQADKYYNILINFCHDIANNPEIGKNYDGIRADLFGFKASCHIIFYRRINTNLVEIVRILHERMDLKNRVIE